MPVSAGLWRAALTGVGQALVAVCSRMLVLPVSIQMVLWTMRSMIASAWTPPPRRWCQSFFPSSAVGGHSEGPERALMLVSAFRCSRNG